MSSFVVNGGRSLYGRISVHGAKNSVLPILAATVISGETSEIHNCPNLSDVDSTIKILRGLSCGVTREGDCITVDSSVMSGCEISDALMREMRSSVIFLGAILARTGRVSMSYPGGCELGPRPIDLHIYALSELGATVEEHSGRIECTTDGLVGKDIHLTFPSVGATENIMLAAVSAKGTTRIFNAAREPEIEDLQSYLLAAGARVYGAGTSTVVIEGGRRLRGTKHSIIPDRIVASTYMAAVAMAGGAATLESVRPEHVASVISVLRHAGCEITERENMIAISRQNSLTAVKPIRTMPYPGFPTDAQSIIMSVMAIAKGTTMFVENIFESRYRHAGELMRMGADIRTEGRVAVVSGVDRLHGAELLSPDLRGGAALVIAALCAEGRSVIQSQGFIERGYDDLAGALNGLGADVRMLPDSGEAKAAHETEEERITKQSENADVDL